ncbi:TVP38/TMEM64 family protein [Gemella cuniculi]|uniref:TVP38/TMEM64 family protein n=1 Tax=Gemella cuniculi TaxID=150240 RepID=UPI00041373BE|nr:TVP38/TMEM64 family protein [Gemella cuniculi]
MQRLRLLFYFTSVGVAIGYFFAFLLFFFVQFEMLADQSLVLFVWTIYGIMTGLYFKRINRKYTFFIIEAIIITLAVISGKTTTLLYIAREVLHAGSLSQIKVPFLIGVVVVNLINIYIIATLPKYQKVYTKEERKALKEKEVKLSDLREVNPEEEKREKVQRKTARYITIICFAVFFAFYFTVPSFKEGINTAFATLSQFDTNAVIEYLRSWGAWAAVVSGVLMVLQSIAAPIPAFLITLSNAAIFGWVIGAALSWSTAMIGAAVCFYIARGLGRDVVEKLTSKGAMASIDVFFERYGDKAILICRLLPFVSFDFVSYAAGLTNMGFWRFFIATGIGQLPATIVYSYVGGTLSGGARNLFIGLMCLFALSIVIGIMKRVYTDKHKKEEELKATKN